MVKISPRCTETTVWNLMYPPTWNKNLMPVQALSLNLCILQCRSLFFCRYVHHQRSLKNSYPIHLEWNRKVKKKPLSLFTLKSGSNVITYACMPASPEILDRAQNQLILNSRLRLKTVTSEENVWKRMELFRHIRSV